MPPAQIPWWNVDLTEVAVDRVVSAMRDRKISQGPLTSEFEQALASRLGIGHAVCTTSGTSALTMAFMALGISPGDEVIIPNRTWVATANAALILGARVRPVDSLPGDCLVDPDRIEAAITPATKAIVPVALNGKAVDIDRILEIGRSYGIPVIEDSCQALFSRRRDGRYMGTSTRFACFSLGMAKALTTGAGGFVVCDDEEDARLLRRIRNQGMSDYDLSERHSIRAGNFKFTDIQAAVGLSQIPLVDARVANQQAIHRLYEAALKPLADRIRLIPVDVDGGEVPMRTEVLVKDPRALQAALQAEGIGTSLQAPAIAEFPFIGADPNDFPHSIIYGHHMLVLPCGPDQPLSNVERAIEVLLKLAPGIERW